MINEKSPFVLENEKSPFVLRKIDNHHSRVLLGLKSGYALLMSAELNTHTLEVA
jgi:hypothetical protein